MKRVAFVITILAAAFAAACSGGGSAPTPPPPTGGFTNASLKGQYAFLMSGQDGFGFFGRVGVFVADGNGNITGGVEDVNSAGGIGTLSYASSTYSIQADGRGVVNLVNSSGTTSFSVTLVSTTQGLIAETDNIATASGTFYLQNMNAFSQTAVSGPYVFDVSGIDGAGNPDSIIGQISANGGGGLSSGLLDENDAATPSGPQPFTTGNYQMDATFGSTFGRGTLSFIAGGIEYDYIYYIVTGNRIRFIETNSNALTLGDAVTQTSPPTANSQVSGSFAFLVSGAGVLGNASTVMRASRFTADGNGGLTGVALDDNDGGVFAQVPHGSLSNQTYAVDTTNGGGRVTLTFKDSSLGQYQFIAYMISPTQGVIQDNSAGIIADGTISQQTGGPFSASSLAGDFAFNWTGLSGNNQTGAVAEEDYVGHIGLDNSGNVTGAVDFSEFSSNNGVFLNTVVSGNLALGGDGTTSTGTRNNLTAKINTSPSSTINFTAYIVNPSTIYVMGDTQQPNNRVIGGTLIKQSQ